MDRKIGKRPTKNELVKRSIVPDQGEPQDKEADTKQRADILAMLMDTKKCTDNDESEISTRDGTTDTTDFSESTEDDEAVSLEDQAIILFATKPERVRTFPFIPFATYPPPAISFLPSLPFFFPFLFSQIF